MRKPIQIAALRFEKEHKGSTPSIETEIIALCDDGTIWTMFGTLSEWVSLPRIPQEQIFEDWLSDVGNALISNHIRKDAIPAYVEERRGRLLELFNRAATAKDAAFNITHE